MDVAVPAVFTAPPPKSDVRLPVCEASSTAGIISASEMTLRTSAIVQIISAMAPGFAAYITFCENTRSCGCSFSMVLILERAINEHISPAVLSKTPPIMSETGPAMLANVISFLVEASFRSFSSLFCTAILCLVKISSC